MDKGTWIALAVMVFASIGVAVLLMWPESHTTNTPATSTAAATAPQDCQAVANAAAAQEQSASGETTSVVEAHFNESQQKCYYELTSFGTAGTVASIRVAPNDQMLASCTTSSTNNLLCKNADGSSITEPQFKALLSTYLAN